MSNNNKYVPEFQVGIRIRKLVEKDKQKKAVILDDGKITIRDPEKRKPDKTFKFDAIFDENITTKQIYDIYGFDILDSIFEGYNGTLLSYGASNGGKTYTMSSDPNGGLIQNVFTDLFKLLKNKEGEQENVLVKMSLFQIYKNEVSDLLYCEDKEINKKNVEELKITKSKGKLLIREKVLAKEKEDKKEKKSIFYVEGLTEYDCISEERCRELFKKGLNNRVVGKTKLNSVSSRSHAILKITVLLSSDPENVREGNLFIVDLAGAEKVKKSEVQGLRLQEVRKINLDMLALCQVIMHLSSGKSHAPFRDSNLTKLLSNSIGGNSKTLFIANISPSVDCYEETLNVLRYAQAAKFIKNRAEINEDKKDIIIRELQNENLNLKKEIDELQKGIKTLEENRVSNRYRLDSDIEVTVEESEEEEDSRMESTEQKIRKKRKKILKFKLKQISKNEEYMEQIKEITKKPDRQKEIDIKIKEEVARKRKKAKAGLIQLLRNETEYDEDEHEILNLNVSNVKELDSQLFQRMHDFIMKQQGVIEYQKAQIDAIVGMCEAREDLFDLVKFDFSKRPNHTEPTNSNEDTKVCVIQ